MFDKLKYRNKFLGKQSCVTQTFPRLTLTVAFVTVLFVIDEPMCYSWYMEERLQTGVQIASVSDVVEATAC